MFSHKCSNDLKLRKNSCLINILIDLENECLAFQKSHCSVNIHAVVFAQGVENRSVAAVTRRVFGYGTAVGGPVLIVRISTWPKWSGSNLHGS